MSIPYDPHTAEIILLVSFGKHDMNIREFGFRITNLVNKYDLQS